jgi:hypothetical protein
MQPNGWMDDWVDFYRERRLGHMLRLVNDSNLNSLGKRLLPNLDKFFKGVQVEPSPQCKLLVSAKGYPICLGRPFPPAGGITLMRGLIKTKTFRGNN